MRYLPIALAFSLAALALPAAAGAADPDGPVFSKGPVWDFTFVRTQDGHFDDYVTWLAGEWQDQQEAFKKAGYISSYKVMLVTDPRKDEPDLILATEYPNMAAFDRSSDEEYAFQKKLFGSVTTANQKQAARGSIRTIQGDILTREIKLK